jgi:ABC-2 type transport system permease protein
MYNTVAIARREIEAYFVSPIAYVVTAAFLVIMSIFFAWYISDPRGIVATMQYMFGPMTTLFLFTVPMLTMRLLAEEQRSGTIELLLTSPIRDWELVLGKYLASIGLIVVILCLTLYYPIVMSLFGNPDIGPILSGYLGLFLFAAALASLGLLASSLTQNQIVAVIIGLSLGLLFWMSESVADFVGTPLEGIFSAISLRPYFPDFAMGIVDTRNVMFYLTFVAVSLFVTVRSVESRRWR